MQEQRTERKQQTRVSQLAASKRFGKYKKEEAKPVRTQVINENKTVEKIKKVWRECNFDYDLGNNVDMENYRKFCYMLRDIRYTPKDVELFSIALAASQEESSFSAKLGHFLSALTNSGKDDKYIIQTSHFIDPPKNIGIYNTKEIMVIGDVRSAASMMKGGRLILHGTVFMLAVLMEGGEVKLHGDVLAIVGSDMEGGEIHVEGEIGSIGDVIHGKIFHKGKLIVDK